MKEGFGEFKWNCWKDHKPDKEKYVYTYFSKNAENDEVYVQMADDVYWEDDDYWCYVHIPSPPKKKLTLEERVEKLESNIKFLMNNSSVCFSKGTVNL